jgi:hypothetical protein
MNNFQCPVCSNKDIKVFTQVKEYTYYQCASCELIFISWDILNKIDQGEGLIQYSENYWRDELYAARERSWGVALARVAELFLYARIPINKFIDIGSGPGYLLDSLQYQLPSSSEKFFANELFPPADEYCTTNKNYLRGNLLDFSHTFDAGCCIEVIEHLTPSIVKSMFTDLAARSRENSIYLFNTGLVEYIINEDINYLDPFVRGHIVGWSIKGLRILLEPLGFKISQIPGKTWAFLAEYRPSHNFATELIDRIWQALPENINALKDKKTGDLMYILGIETARAYT